MEVRGQIHSDFTSEAIRSLDPTSLANLRSDLLKTDPFQQLLRESGLLRDFVSGVHSMYKAGWFKSWSDTRDSLLHGVRILVNAKDNLDCPFLYLRQCPGFFEGIRPLRKSFPGATEKRKLCLGNMVERTSWQSGAAALETRADNKIRRSRSCISSTQLPSGNFQVGASNNCSTLSVTPGRTNEDSRVFEMLR